jgi:hypothetical protein
MRTALVSVIAWALSACTPSQPASSGSLEGASNVHVPSEPAPAIREAPPSPSAMLPDPMSDPCATYQSVGDVSGPLPPFVPGEVVCGDRSCQAHTELCCPAANDGKMCVPYQGDRSDIVKLAAACRQGGGVDDSYPIPCDDSSDCPPSHTCCDEPIGYPGYAVCKRLEPTGWNACEGSERCLSGSPCRSAGTTCKNGVCAAPTPPGVSIPCFGMTCSGERLVCCGPPRPESCQRPARCVADRAECYHHSQILTCLGPHHCPAHQTCQVNMMGQTGCAEYQGGGMVGIACRTAKDCPAWAVMGRPAKCVDDVSTPGLKVCTADPP